MYPNLKHTQGLTIVRLCFQLSLTPILPMLNASNTNSVLANVLVRMVVYLLRGGLQVSTCSAWEQLLAWKHGFVNHLISEYLTVQPCCILNPLLTVIFIALLAKNSSVEFRRQQFLFYTMLVDQI